MQRSALIEPLDWQQFGEPEQLASCFYQHPDFIWLDSASTDHANSRFHIIAWSPRLKVTATHGELKIHSDDLALQNIANSLNADCKNSPFAILRSLQEKLAWQSSITTELPFDGGWLGFWGYDLGRYLEKLPAEATADIDFPDMSIGWYDVALIIDQVNHQVWLAGEHQAVAARKAELVPAVTPPIAPFRLTSNWRSNMTQAQYSTKFASVQNYLKSGDCYQVNLAQRHQACFSGSPFAAYLQLRKDNAGPFSAYINHPQGQILSLSPERFIECRAGQIETKPIKGTRPRSDCAASDQRQAQQLQHAEKDRAENLMIVDLLRNDLGKVAAPGSVQVPVLFGIESFPSVHHLVSTIRAKLSEQHDSYDLLAGAFPGGSITGAPKIRAMEIIDELEPHRRNIYCGAIGYISVSGNMDSNITIRTLLCDAQQRIFCWAGGGLVADSNCDDEYQETHDKVSRILPKLKHKQ